MIHYLRLCRLYYAIPMSLILMLTIWYAVGDRMPGHLSGAIIATAAMALVISGGYVLNDVVDVAVDRINRPGQTISAEAITPRAGFTWAAGLLIGGLAVAGLCRWQFLAALVVVVIILVVYDFNSKRLGVGKPLLVSLLMTSFYPLAFAQAGPDATSGRVETLYIFPAWLFLTSFGYELLKDIRDVRGDATIGAHNAWIKDHPRRAFRLARASVIAGGCVLFGPVLAGCGWVYLAIIPAAVATAIASAWFRPTVAMMLIYAEAVIVGIAATADIIILGP